MPFKGPGDTRRTRYNRGVSRDKTFHALDSQVDNPAVLRGTTVTVTGMAPYRGIQVFSRHRDLQCENRLWSSSHTLNSLRHIAVSVLLILRARNGHLKYLHACKVALLN